MVARPFPHDSVEIVEWDCMGWSVRCLCGAHVFVPNDIYERDKTHTCERCGAELYLQARMDVYVGKRGVMPEEEE